MHFPWQRALWSWILGWGEGGNSLAEEYLYVLWVTQSHHPQNGVQIPDSFGVVGLFVIHRYRSFLMWHGAVTPRLCSHPQETRTIREGVTPLPLGTQEDKRWGATS